MARSSIVKESLHTLVVRVLNVVIAAALGILTARLLGPAQRGIFMLPALDSAIAGALLTGLNSASAHYMLSHGRGKGVLTAAFWASIVFVAAGIAIVAALGMVEHRAWTILPAAVSLLPIAVITVVSGYCVGIHRVTYANLLTVLTALTGLVFMALGLSLLGRRADVAIQMWIASSFVTAAVAIAFVWRHSRGTQGAPVDVRSFVLFAAKSGSANVLTVLNLRVDVYIVAALSSAATLGIYTVAVAGAEALKILTVVLSQTAAPRIGSSDSTQAAAFTAKCIRNNFLIALVPSAAIVILAPWLIQTLYGAKFLAGTSPLRILSIGIFASAASSLLSTFYTLKMGRPMLSFWNNAFSASLCCGLSFVLVPRFGMNGAAIASTFAYVVSEAAFLRIFVKETGLPILGVLFIQREDRFVWQRVWYGITRRLHAGL